MQLSQELKISGTQGINVNQGDTIEIQAKGSPVLSYTVPAGWKGDLTVNLTGTLEEK